MIRNKKALLFSGIFSILFFIVYIHAFDSKLDLNGDNANYIRLAENISKGIGYADMTPDGVVPASHYPPGYSFFLSIFMMLGIHNLIFFKIINGLFLYTSILLLFYLVKKITSNDILAFSISLLTIFSPQLLHFSNIVMSEMIFTFFSILCFFSIYKLDVKNPALFWKSPWFYVSIISAVLSYYVRTTGLAVMLSLGVYYIFKLKWKEGLCSVFGMILLNIPWYIRNSIHGIESRYFGTIMTINPWRPEKGNISSVSEFIEKMVKNFDETVIKGFKEILFPFLEIDYGKGSGIGAVIAGFLILAILFYGAWQLKPLRWVLIAYLAGQIGLFMLWHGGNGSRYVVPIAPLLFVLFYSGLYFCIRLLSKKQTKLLSRIPYIFLLMILFMQPKVSAFAKMAKKPYPPAYQNYFTMAKEMNKQLPDKSICCCRKPELFMYYAPKIYAVSYVYDTNTTHVIQELINQKVDYVILEQLGYSSTSLYLYPAIQANPDLFESVLHLKAPDTYLFKFDRIKANNKLRMAEKSL